MIRLSEIFLSILFFTSFLFPQSGFKLGNENFLANETAKLKDKKLALVVNETSRLSDGTFLVDTLINLGCSVRKLFVLEHGFKLRKAPGEEINDSVYKGIPIVSLYGKKKAPGSADMAEIDIVIYDIQDVGTRFYTYISSLKLIMEAAAKFNKEIYVLDRPDPQGGKTEGELILPKFRSFVGIAEIPVVYGMTAGELSLYFADEIRKNTETQVKLKVVEMSEYDRSGNYFVEKKSLRWIPPSPNLRTLEAALLYPALCFLEATNISEGRGTEKPFEMFGSPFLDVEKTIAELKASDFGESLSFEPTEFVPQKRRKFSPKFAGESCYGIEIKIKKRNFNAVLFGVKLLKILKKTHGEKIKINYDWLAKLYGNENAERYLKGEITFDDLNAKMNSDVKKFESRREKFLLY